MKAIEEDNSTARMSCDCTIISDFLNSHYFSKQEGETMIKECYSAIELAWYAGFIGSIGVLWGYYGIPWIVRKKWKENPKNANN